MPLRPESQLEPIPGYRLLERLGSGGFGEVWKCEAPGGLLKAIKFVHGDLESTEEDGKPAEQELRALSRVKTVRHPYILSLERYDIIDGQLLIVMELADRNLADRFRECRKQSLIGIPREELLGYMDESAEALDLMNDEYNLQHLDIKPQNLFLIRNHVKVADFGLVKDFEGRRTAVTGGVTPLYAAPEIFDNFVTRFCDQYSLAIVYQELLTGTRPFNGNTSRQLILQHLQGVPNLTPLPAQDRAVIARALSKNPDARHPSCTAMVKALRGASRNGAAPAAPPGSATSPGGSAGTDHPSAGSVPKNLNDAVTWREPGAQPPAGPPGALQSAALQAAGAHAPGVQTPPPGLPSGSGSSGSLPAVTPALTPLPSQMATPVASLIPPLGAVSTSLPQTSQQFNEALFAPRTDIRVPAETSYRPVAPVEMQGIGVLSPTVVLGIGGFGHAVLQKLRGALNDSFDSLDRLPNIRYLHLDTDPEGGGELIRDIRAPALTPHQSLVFRLNRAAHYLRPRDGMASMDSWFDSKTLFRIPRNQLTTGLRTLGRLALADQFRVVTVRLKTELEACLDPGLLAAADRSTKLGIRSNRPRVYLITSLAGGTGSGVFLDVAYLVRNYLRKCGYDRPELIGRFVLPPVEKKPTPRGSVALGNAYAALTELHHFSRPETVYSAQFYTKDPPLRDPDPPFSRCLMLPVDPKAAPADATRTVVDLAGAYLYYNLVTPLGRVCDASRSTQEPPADRFVCSTVGMYRLSWPRKFVTLRAAQRLGSRLVKRWNQKDPGPVRDHARAWADQTMADHELGPGGLIPRLQAGIEQTLGYSAEAYFGAILDPLEAAGDHLPPAAVAQAIAQLDILLNRRPDGHPPDENPRLPEVLEHLAHRFAEDGKKLLHTLTVGLTDDPTYRIAGAEEAIRHLATTYTQLLAGQETMASDLMSQAAELRGRAVALGGSIQGFSGWWRRKSSVLGDLLTALRQFAKVRYQGLLLQSLGVIYRVFIGGFPEFLREVGFFRSRLADLERMLRETAGRDVPVRALGPGRFLFPAGCKTLDEAVTRLEDGVSEDEIRGLDGAVQDYVRKHHESVGNLCTNATHHFPALAQVISDLSESFLDAVLNKANAPQLYLGQHPEQAEAVQHLQKLFDYAAPAAEPGGDAVPAETRAALVPNDPWGKQFIDLAAQALPDLSPVPVKGGEDILFYRECMNVPLTALPQTGQAAQDAYEGMFVMEHFPPHTRNDITDWLFPQ